MVAVTSSSLKDSSAWGAELRRHLGPELSQGHSRPAGLLALAAAHALLAAVHAASRLELAARRCTLGLRSFTGDITWQTSAVAALGLASLWGFKRLLDAASATDGALLAAAAALAVHGPAAAACCSFSCCWHVWDVAAALVLLNTRTALASCKACLWPAQVAHRFPARAAALQRSMPRMAAP